MWDVLYTFFVEIFGLFFNFAKPLNMPLRVLSRKHAMVNSISSEIRRLCTQVNDHAGYSVKFSKGKANDSSGDLVKFTKGKKETYDAECDVKVRDILCRDNTFRYCIFSD